MNKILRKISASMLAGLTALALCTGSFQLNAEGEQPKGEESMPEGFITSLEICKSINEGQCTKFGDEEIEKDAELNLFFEYKVPAEESIQAEQTYTFDIEGNFKDALPFTIFSNHITENKGIAANGYVDGNTVKLTFTKEAEVAGLLAADTTGNFWFGAHFDGDKIENSGLQEFTANAQGNSTSSTLNFVITPISANVALTKVSTVDIENKKITWTINVDPTITNAPNDKQILETLTITDKLPDKLTYVESSVTDNGKISFNEGLVTVEFNDLDVKTNPVITIVTSFDPTAEGFLTENKATFKNQVNADYTYPQIKKDNDPNSLTYNKAIDAEPGTGKAEPAEATAEITGSLLDKTGSLLNGNTMIWTIKVQNSLGLENPTIKDELPADTLLVDGTLKLGEIEIKKDKENLPYYELNGRYLTIHLEKNTSEQVITYETKFDKDWKDKDGKVVNTAEFYGGPGAGLLIKKAATVQLGRQLLTKNGTYDASDHTITWKIDVKNTGDGLKDIVLTDTIPAGQELVGSDDISNSVKAEGSSNIDYNSTSNTITFTYADRYNNWNNQSPDIEYKTVLTDDQKNLWGNNTSKKNAENTIAISATGLPAENLSVTGKAPIVSKVLKKDYVRYSFIDKQVIWQLTVNENQMALNNAKIVDTLPEGWKFVEDSVEVTQDTQSIPNFIKSFDKQDMSLELPAMAKGEKPYIITYEAQLVDEKLLATNKEIIAENTSVLTGDEIVDGGVSVTGSHKIAQSVIEKKGDNKNFAKEGYLSWEILVNRNLSEINAQSGKNVIIIDELNENLIPVMDSVQVYKLQLDANGKETDRTLLKDNEFLVNYAVPTKTLSIDFKKNKLTDAYCIAFNTDVLESGKYTNSAHFEGMPTENMSASSQSINAQFSGGSTTTSYGKVDAEVKNDKDESLVDVEFSIYKKDSKTPLYTGITLKDLASLTLRSGQYTLMITKVPDGYLMPSNPSQEFEITKDGTSQLNFQLDKKPESSGGGSSGGNTPKPVPPVEPVDPDKEVEIPSDEIVPEGDSTINNDSVDNNATNGNDTGSKDNNNTNGIPNTSDPTGTYMLLGLLSLGLLLVCVYIDNKRHLEK